MLGLKSEIRNPKSEIGFVPLAIVGIGCLFPKADGLGAYWANIKHGVDCIGDVPPTHWNPDDYYDADPKSPDHTYARRGGFLTPIDFNPLEFGIAPRDLEATDTSQLLGLVAAKQALTDAGIVFDTPGGTARGKTSVILGVTGTLELVIPLGARLGHPKWRAALKDAGVADDVAQDVVERIGECYVPWQENSFPGLLGNVVAGRIANRLDLHGTNCVVDAACASSLSAVHLAAMELATGKADVVVTGGVDTFNDIFMFMCFSKTPALSKSGESRPFDSNGDGTALGEGLGMVVLKRLADAEASGDTIYAVLKGIGTSSDGKGNAIYAPSSEGQKRCLNDAYARAGVNPGTVELVEAHGTGTKVGDAAEATALTDVFRNSGHALGRPWCALGSVKSQIGHTKAAAGAASLIKVALSLFNKVLPPTIKVNRPVDPLNSPESPFYVNAQMRPWLPRIEHPRRAGLSAFGFGGSNFHAVLEEYRPAKIDPDWDGRVEILAVSGRTVEGLLSAFTPFGEAPTWNEFARAAEASRAAFDSSAPVRLVLVAQRGKTDLAQLVARAKARLTSQSGSQKWQTAEGAFFGTGPAGKLAVLFPGQGSQSVGMLRELACTFPEILESLDRANAGQPGDRLSDFIYPPTSFAADSKSLQDEALKATDIAQPALGAVSYGAYRVLNERFGLNADCFAGHSYGELPALAAAKRISDSDFYRLSRRRGDLMAAQRVGDAGAMLAVLAPLSEIEVRLIPGVVIANKNAPLQTVLAGSTADIEAIAKIYASHNIRAIKLPVAAAFHSDFVAEAARPFRHDLDSVDFAAGAPVYSNTTGSEYPAEADSCRDALGHQLAKPVEFVAQIQAMLRDGVRTFFEVGPGGTLAKLTQSIVTEAAPADDVEAIALESPKHAGMLDLALALAKLAARGHAVDLGAWEANGRCRPAPLPSKPIMTVPIGGANIVQPRPKRPARPPISSSNSSVPPSKSSAGIRPMNDPQSTELSRALQVTQQTLAALQKMQEQTAQLHKQFLESQESAQRTLHQLVAQQQSLFFGTAAPAPDLIAFLPREILPPVAIRPVPVPVAPAPKPLAVPPPPPAAKSVHPGVAETLLAVVAEKTGYPVDMLNLGMSLDGDLGVDSIKRVEILSALQDKLPAAPVVKPEHLGTLHTLQDVADFLSIATVPAIATLSPSRSGANVSPTREMRIDPILFAEAPATLIGPVTFDTVFPAGIEPDVAGDIAAILLAVVAEKTGYPVDMLNLGMSLDGDLGVDSIKRVEILSALQDKLPAAPVVKPEHLGALHTLQDVADFLATGGGVASVLVPKTEPISAIRMPEITPAFPVEPRLFPTRTIDGSASANRSAASVVALDNIDRSILQAVDLDLAAPRPRLKVPENSAVWIVSGEDSLGRELVAQFQSRKLEPELYSWTDPIPTDGRPVGLVLIPPIAPVAAINRTAFLWAQAAAPKLRSAGRAAFFGTVVQLDGAFGLMDLAVNANPALGGFAGLVKTARHEWPEVACKAIDLAPDFAREAPAAAAVAIADELLCIGPVEVGISESHRCTVELARTVRKPSSKPLPLGPNDVILITGGGRGVTAEVAAALAETFKPTLVLTGRTSIPTGPEPAWMSVATDEAGLKKAIAEHLGATATPKSVSEMYHKALAQREIRSNLARMERAGSKVVYLVANVANSRQVADLLHQIQVKHGAITGLIHGAGVLADKRIEDLTAEQFDTVYSTKVDGLRNLLDHLGGQELKMLILFSSTTARFGRVGQAAYAAANEVLNKTAQVESRRRPNTRVAAINWGPWDGGMVTANLRKVFESEGIGMIPLTEGGLFVIQELNLSGRAAEVVALGKFRSAKGHTAPSGAIASIPRVEVPAPNAAATAPPPEMTAVFERTIDLATHPVLRSHVIDGRAVFPMVLHMEWLAHAALHGNPGLLFHGFNEMRVMNGILIDEAVPATVRAFAGRGTKSDKYFLVPVELRGRRRDGREVVHSRAEVVLASALPKPPAPNRVPELQPYPHPLEEVYRHFLFHGPELRGIERIEGVAEGAFAASVHPAPAPGEWIAEPLRNAWVADPLVLDVSFQMMILWSYAQHGAGSLPCFAGRYRQYRRAFTAGPVLVRLRITRDSGTYARADIDYLDPADGSVIAQIQDYECVIDPQLNQAFRRNQLGPRAKA